MKRVLIERYMEYGSKWLFFQVDSLQLDIRDSRFGIRFRSSVFTVFPDLKKFQDI